MTNLRGQLMPRHYSNANNARLAGYRSGTVRRERRDQRLGDAKMVAQDLQQQGYSYAFIAERLNQKKLLNLGKRWYAATVWALLNR